MFKKIKDFFNSFKYYVVADYVISWYDGDAMNVVNSVALTFYENGRKKRKVKKGFNNMPDSCKVEAHQYWQLIVIPWLNEYKMHPGLPMPTNTVVKKESKGNVVTVDFGKKK